MGDAKYVLEQFADAVYGLSSEEQGKLIDLMAERMHTELDWIPLYQLRFAAQQILDED